MVYGLFFLSGAAALAYEASWSRLVGLSLGNTAAAAAVVLAGFFAGLAGGQLLGGCLASRIRPLLGYGLAELAAAAWSALVPTLLPPAGIDGGLFPDASSAVSAAWCFAVLLPSTVALGSTLPFMAAHFSRRGDRGRQFALAYALNTAGGLTGVLVTTVVLLVVVGVRASGYLAAGVSAACGFTACLLAVCQGFRPGPLAPNTAPGERGGIPPVWWAVAAVSGFGTLGLEVLYTRLFALVFHNSSYSFGAVVAVFLAGLAAGAALVAAIGSRVSPRTTVAVSASLGAVAVAASVVVFVRRTGLEYFAAGGTFADYLSHALGLVAAVVLPPSVILGMALPAAFVGAGGTGRAVGRLAAVNTTAAVAGALVAGFVLPPCVGLWESVGLFVLLFGVTGAAMLYAHGIATAAAGVGLLTAIATVVAASGQALVPPALGEEVVRRWDTAYGWIDVVRNTKDGSLTVRQNLHYRHGSTGKTAAREYRQGRLPLLLHPRPADVAFLGLGTGLTAAPVVIDRGAERAVVVELIPEVVEAARLLSPANLGVVDHPKVEVRVGDARHYLARADRRFDVVVSDLFVPWESRTGYLYTVEFYESVRGRLKPGGLFCQWLALYQVGPEEFELIADSFAAVFPNVTLWWGQFDARFGILALVGSDAPLELDPDRLAARWSAAGDAPGGVDSELTSGAAAPELFLGRWPTRPAATLNTDEHPRLEFRAPVSQQSGRALRDEELRAYFDRVLVNLPQDGIRLVGDWPPADREPTKRRERQRLNLFGPD